MKDERYSPRGAQAVARYSDLESVKNILKPHRPDGLSNLKSVSLITWRQLGQTLCQATQNASLPSERGYAERALEWLGAKGLVTHAG